MLQLASVGFWRRPNYSGCHQEWSNGYISDILSRDSLSGVQRWKSGGVLGVDSGECGECSQRTSLSLEKWRSQRMPFQSSRCLCSDKFICPGSTWPSCNWSLSCQLLLLWWWLSCGLLSRRFFAHHSQMCTGTCNDMCWYISSEDFHCALVNY